MVPLPLFKLAALFVRHLSKYGANQIKHRTQTHPRLRQFAERYGQRIHQLNMRLNVALLRESSAEKPGSREKATAKTKEQAEKEEEMRAKYGTTARESSHAARSDRDAAARMSVWKRQFKPLPEAKAVELFADVVGDGFILAVAMALIILEFWRSSQKPDANAERYKELSKKLEDLKKREDELEEAERRAQKRVRAIEEALGGLKDPKTQQPLLSPSPAA